MSSYFLLSLLSFLDSKTRSLLSRIIGNLVVDNSPPNFEVCRHFLNPQSAYASFDKKLSLNLVGVWWVSQVFADYQIIFVNYVRNVNYPFNFSSDSSGITIKIKSVIYKIYHELWLLNIRTWYTLLYIMLHFFILTRAFPLLFYVGRILLEILFSFNTHKKSSLSKSVVALVKIYIFLCSLAICLVSKIFVADYG